MAVGGVELLPLHGFTDGRRRRFAGFFHGLRPQEDLEIRTFQRVMGHRLGIVDELAVAFDERIVGVRIDGLEVGERGIAAGRVLSPHGRDLDLGRNRRTDR